MSKRKGFTPNEKLKHYSCVASGKIPTKKDSKFTKKEQISYAKGQRDSRNESRVLYAKSHK